MLDADPPPPEPVVFEAVGGVRPTVTGWFVSPSESGQDSSQAEPMTRPETFSKPSLGGEVRVAVGFHVSPQMFFSWPLFPVTYAVVAGVAYAVAVAVALVGVCQV